MKNIKGHFKVDTIDKSTGQITEVFSGRNVIVTTANFIVLKAISDSVGTNLLAAIRIGSDVGSGTNESPEPPNQSYTTFNQDVVYSTTTNVSQQFVYTYPTPNTLRLVTDIDGETAMQNYPEESFKEITSAALMTVSDELFAYRRFPRVAISRDLNLRITWTIGYE